MLRENDVVSSERERMDLGMCLRGVVMIDMVDNAALMSEEKYILIKAHDEYGTLSDDDRKIKVKVKESVIAVQNHQKRILVARRVGWVMIQT